MLLFLYVEAQINHVLFIVANIFIKANRRRNQTAEHIIAINLKAKFSILYWI